MPSAPAVIALAVTFNGCATAGWNALDALSAEAFETDVRATAFSVFTGTGRVASILAQVVNGALASHVATLLSVTSACMALGCLGALALGLAKSHWPAWPCLRDLRMPLLPVGGMPVRGG